MINCSTSVPGRAAPTAARLPLRPGRSTRTGRAPFDVGLQPAQIARNVGGFAHAHDDFPVAQFLFQFAADLRDVSRDDDLAMVDLLSDAALLHEHGDGVGHEPVSYTHLRAH